jgi:hypothetical protein
MLHLTLRTILRIAGRLIAVAWGLVMLEYATRGEFGFGVAVGVVLGLVLASIGPPHLRESGEWLSAPFREARTEYERATAPAREAAAQRAFDEVVARLAPKSEAPPPPPPSH